MRIALVTPMMPHPADSGSRIRVAQIVRTLKAHHDLAILSLEDGDIEAAASELGVPISYSRFQPGRGIGPFRIGEATTRAVWQFVAGWRADAVHFEKTFGAAAEGLPRTPPPVPVILDEGCVHHVSYQRQAGLAHTTLGRARALLRFWRLRRFEQRLAVIPQAVIAVSEDEAALLRRLAPNAHVVVAPNGVDTDTVRPSPPGDAILFVGLMNYEPNRDAVRFFATEILPRLHDDRGGPEFLVVGREPGTEIAQLASVDGRIRLLGFVPDLQPVYARAGVFVNPMRGGGGTRLKVLEAMAAGKAVVSTPVGAEGLKVTPGSDILLADTPAAFADAITRLLADRQRAARLGQAARALVEAHYRWESCLAPLEAVYDGLASNLK